MAEMWTLRISSFRGIAFNAEHWYANVVAPGGRRVSVDCLLDDAYAAALNDKDPSFHHEAGEFTHRWRTESDAVAAGIIVWLHLGPHGPNVVLCKGEGLGNPIPALAGDAALVAQVNALVDRDADGESVYAEWDDLFPHPPYDNDHGYPSYVVDLAAGAVVEEF